MTDVDRGEVERRCRLVADVPPGLTATRLMAAERSAADVPVLLAALDAREAELARLRASHAAVETALADLLSGAEVVDADGAVAALRRSTLRPCTRCGRLIPPDMARCDPVCPTVVVSGGPS